MLGTGTNLGEIFVKLGADIGPFLDSLDKAFKSVGNFGDKMETLGKSFSLYLTTPLVGAGVAIGKFGMDFEKSFGKVSTMFGATKVNSEALEKKLLALSDSANIVSNELTESLYEALSSGIPITEDASEAMGFMEKSVKLSKAGFTSLTSAVDVTTSIMNAYGLSVEDVDRIQNALIITQDKGKTTVDELSSSLSNVVPIAASLGVPFEQIGAALAAITAQGVPTAQATTQLRAAFSELAKSGTTASDAFKKLSGQSFDEFIAAGNNIQDAFQLMGDSAAKSGLKIGDMFSSIEAAQGALILASETGGQAFTNSLTAMNTEVNALNENFEKVSDKVGERWSSAFNQMKNAAISFFDSIAPAVEILAAGISKVAQVLSGMSSSMKVAIVGLGALAAAIGPVMIGMGSLINTFQSISKAIDAVKKSEMAMKALSTAMSGISGAANTAQAGFSALVTRMAAFATSTGGLVVIAGAAAIALGVLVYKTYEYQQAIAQLKAEDLEKSTQRHAEALQNLQKYYPELTSSAQAFQTIQEKGIDNFIREGGTIEELTAILQKAYIERRQITDNLSEEQKTLNELQEEYAKYNTLMMQGHGNPLILKSLAERITKQEEIIDGLQEESSEFSNLINDISGYTDQWHELNQKADTTLNNIVTKLVQIGGMKSLSSLTFEIYDLINAVNQIGLSEEELKKGEEELTKAITLHWQTFEKELTAKLQAGQINELEFQQARKQYANEYISFFKYNEELRVDIVNSANQGILTAEENLYKARLQIAQDLASITEDKKDDYEAELAIRLDTIETERQAFIQKGVDEVEAEAWAVAMVAKAQEELTAKYYDEGEKRKQTVKETAEYEVQVQYESIENQKRGRDLLIENVGLHGETTENLTEQLRILEEQELVLRAEAEEYMRCIKRGEQLGDSALDVLDTYNNTLSSIEEINEKLKEKNSLISDEQKQLEENYKLWLDIKILNGEISQQQADMMLADFLGQQNEELQKQVDLILQKINLYGIGSLTEKEAEILEYYRNQSKELTDINAKLFESSTLVGDISNKTADVTGKQYEYNEAISAGIASARELSEVIGNIKVPELPGYGQTGKFYGDPGGLSGGYVGQALKAFDPENIVNLRSGTSEYYQDKYKEGLPDYYNPDSATSQNISNSTTSNTTNVDQSGDINLNIGGEASAANIPSNVQQATETVASFALQLKSMGDRL